MGNDSMTTDSLLEQAIVALDNDDPATAQKHLASLLQQDPRNERAWLLMAEAQAEPERKRFCIEKVLALNPNNMMALQMRAELAHGEELNRAPDAPASAPETATPPEATPVAPQSGNLWPEPVAPSLSTDSSPAFIRQELERAVDLIESGNRSAGMARLEQILAVDPNNESALLGMAAATREGDAKIEYLNRVLAVNPKNKAARKMLGELQAPPKPSKFAVTDAVDAATDVKEYDWVEAWTLALTRPTSKTYASLLADPNAGALRALTWIVATALFGAFFFILMQAAVLLATGQALPTAGRALNADPLAVIGIALLCAAPLNAVGLVINLSINAAIFNLAGRVLGGRGTFGGQLYAMTLFTAPLLVLGFVAFTFAYLAITLTQNPSLTLLLSCIALPLGLYALYLNVLALKAAQGFGWGRAILAFLLPVLAGVALYACLVFVAAQALGPTFLQDLQRNLPAP
jgi:thioredoxin-like negative regulator of GroEL